jgi:hypothetical protein
LEESGLCDLGFDDVPTGSTEADGLPNARFDFAGRLDHRVATHLGHLGNRRLAAPPQPHWHSSSYHSSLNLVQVGQDGSEESREFVTTDPHAVIALSAY